MSKFRLAETLIRCLLFYTECSLTDSDCFSVNKMVIFWAVGNYSFCVFLLHCCTVRFWFEVKVRPQEISVSTRNFFNVLLFPKQSVYKRFLYFTFVDEPSM